MTKALLLKMIRLIICDLDDTIFPEYDYVISGYREIAKKYSKKMDIDSESIFDQLKSSFDTFVINPFNSFIEKNSLNDNEMDKMIDIYRYHNPHLTLYEDIKDFLEKIRSMDIVITILTDGEEKRQLAKIDSLGIRNYFDYIKVSEEKYFKPHPHGYEEIIGRYQFKNSEILCIGDNPKKDFYYPLEHGMNVVKTNRFVDLPFPDSHPVIKEIQQMTEILTLLLT